ncbi:hypothetical protein [Spiroplasma endosymbiont of Othius punctulatus]|uniref:hypothetical protein n=1 Tax=Spiroplasma endosymbiont of Othius punctulatus TaxID=3066289 RepID=UPI0030D12B79
MRKILIIPFILLLVVTTFFGLIIFLPDLINAGWYLELMTWTLKGWSSNSPIKLISSELLKNWNYVCFAAMVLATLMTFIHLIGSFKKKKKTNRHGKIPKVGAVSIAIYILTIVVTALTLTYFMIAVALIVLVTLIMVSSIPNKGSIALISEGIEEEVGEPIFDALQSAEEPTHVAEIVSELSEIEDMDNHVFVQPTPIEEVVSPISFSNEVSFEDMVNEQNPIVEESAVPNFDPILEVEEPAAVEEEKAVKFDDMLSNAKSHYEPYQPIPEPEFEPKVNFVDMLSNAKSHYEPYRPIPEPIQPEPIYIPQPEPVDMMEVINNAKSHYEPYQPIPEPIQPQPVPQPQTIFIPTPEPVYVPQPQPVFIPKTELVFVPVQPEPIYINEPQPQQISRSREERIEMLRQLTHAPQYSEEELYFHPKSKPAPVYKQPFAKKVPQSNFEQPKSPEPIVQLAKAPNAATPAKNNTNAQAAADAYRDELRKKILSRIK